MTLKSDAKFKEKLTCGFKYDMRKLVNFDPTTQKSENFASIGYFCPKVYEVWAKKIQWSYLSLHWTVMQINPELVVSNMAWATEWTFIRALKSLKNCAWMGSFCPKHIMFQLENFRGIMCHDTKGWCKIWISPDLVVSKMAWGVRETFSRALKVKKKH